MNVEFIQAIEEIVREKGIKKEVLLDTIEQALLTAYKRNFGSAQNVRVEMNADKGEIKVFSQREVVDSSDVYDNFLEIGLDEAKEVSPNYEMGDIIEKEVTPRNFGRIAAQTAKQMVVQKIREVERENTFREFEEKLDEIVTGEISRVSNKDNKIIVFVNIGKGEAIMLQNEQIPGEKYKTGKIMKFYICDVSKNTKNTQILVSRSHPGLIKRLFEMEVPEVQEGIVQIKSVSREAGSRTKMSVKSVDEKIDPIGACVGAQGARVRNIVEELGDEKIDIVKYNDDPAIYIESSLSPSKVTEVVVNEVEKTALVVVPDYQLSLAIGKEGQNARLAAKLTNWKIDIKSETEFEENKEELITEVMKISEKTAERIKREAEKLAREEAEQLAREKAEQLALEEAEKLALENPEEVEVTEEVEKIAGEFDDIEFSEQEMVDDVSLEEGFTAEELTVEDETEEPEGL